MAILRKLFGILVFLLTYILIFLQIYIINGIDDNYDTKGTYLNYFKLFFFASLVVSTISHLQASMTDPGKITHKNNIRFFEFYCATRSIAVRNADVWNMKNLHFLKQHTIDEELEEICESDCESDDKIYEESPVFTQDKLNEINKKFGFSFEKCPACNVGRMPNVNHCLYCEGCIYSKDHHCPWINNCVGSFNYKYFFNFILYSTVSSLISLFVSSYYVIYRHTARSFSEVITEMFGCDLSMWWIIPFGRGGLYHIFRKKRNS